MGVRGMCGVYGCACFVWDVIRKTGEFDEDREGECQMIWEIEEI